MGEGSKGKGPELGMCIVCSRNSRDTMRLGDMSGERVENAVSFRWSDVCGLGDGS